MSELPPESGPPESTTGAAAPSAPTVLKELLRAKNLQNYGLFKRAYERAAKELDQCFVGTYPSEKTFRRWLAGRVKDLPRAEHCMVLEAMLPGWRVDDLFKPYVAPDDVVGATLLQELLRRRHLLTYRAFCKAYKTAAVLIDKNLAASVPTERQFYCWISGDLIGLPSPDHCNVLEVMFPGYSAQQLFDTYDDAGTADVVDEFPSESPVEISVPTEDRLNLTQEGSVARKESISDLLEPWELVEIVADTSDFDGELNAHNRGGVAVLARTPDGRIVLVTVPRRVFIGLGAAVLGGAVVTAEHSLTSTRFVSTKLTSETAPFLDLSPVEHFRQMRRVFIDNDNLFGPTGVIGAIQDQIAIMRSIGLGLHGTDRQELLRLEAQFAELCGWFHQDAGDLSGAHNWTNRALELSHMGRDDESVSFILARKSQIAGEMGNPAEALDAAEAALGMVDPRSRMAAIAMTFAGQGYALKQDRAGCDRAYAQAQELLQNAEVNPEFTWGKCVDASYVEIQRARSLSCLGEHGTAVEIFKTVIPCLPSGYRRDGGVYLAREARAHAGNDDAEQAATVGLQAVTIGAETGSARILRELFQLDNALSSRRSVPSVIEFRTALKDLLVHRRNGKGVE